MKVGSTFGFGLAVGTLMAAFRVWAAPSPAVTVGELVFVGVGTLIVSAMVWALDE